MKMGIMIAVGASAARVFLVRLSSQLFLLGLESGSGVRCFLFFGSLFSQGLSFS